MEIFTNIALGWSLGFILGVGCSLVVLYAIYQGGYRRAISDSLLEPRPENYRRLWGKASAAHSPMGL